MEDSSSVPLDFNDFSKNVFSQNGEDGIVLRALELIQGKVMDDQAVRKFVVDVGAWDGKHLSNTYLLISEHGYGSVLIECDKKKFKELEQNTKHFDNQFLFNKFIDVKGHSSLDSILMSTPIPRDFDLLSIDIDGMDYYIWESLVLYSPKLVIVEFNPTIPSYVDFIQKKNFEIKHGSSSKSLVKLGLSKGYVLIAKTHCNVIFMAEPLAKSIGIENRIGEKDLDHFFDKNATYLFSGYNGELISNHDKLTLPWHGLNFAISEINALPKFLQKYPHDYSRFQAVCYGFYVNVKSKGMFGIMLLLKGILNELVGNILRQMSPNQRSLIRKIKRLFSQN